MNFNRNNLITIFFALILFIIPGITMDVGQDNNNLSDIRIAHEDCGDYPGTFSFIGEVGEAGTAISFIDVEDPNVASVIKSTYYSHSSVLNFTNPTGNPERVENTLGGVTSGTVELWILHKVKNVRSALVIGQDGSNRLVIEWRDTGVLSMYNGSWNDIEPYNNFTWYHVRIEFDCADDWHLWINGIQKSPIGGWDFMGSPASMNEFYLNTRDEGEVYLDGIGYSWDPSYSVGDNLNEFCPSQICEEYNGTYTFSDEIGESGTAISFIDVEDPNVASVIKSTYYSHSSVLSFTNPTGNPERVENTLEGITSGTVELWILHKFKNIRSALVIGQDGSNRLVIEWRNTGVLSMYNGSWNDIEPYSTNKWYHVRIEFDCADDWHLWINGTQKSPIGGWDFMGSPASMNEFYLNTRDEGEVCLDGIGFSWDPSYSVGDNLNTYCPSGNSPPKIPGYNIFLVLGIFPVILLFLALNNKKYLSKLINKKL